MPTETETGSATSSLPNSRALPCLSTAPGHGLRKPVVSRFRGVISRAFDTPQPHRSPNVERWSAILSLLALHRAAGGESPAVAWSIGATSGSPSPGGGECGALRSASRDRAPLPPRSWPWGQVFPAVAVAIGPLVARSAAPRFSRGRIPMRNWALRGVEWNF